MNKYYCNTVISLFFIFLGLALFTTYAKAAQHTGAVKVGMSAALSGSIAAIGEASRNGLELAIGDLNEKGGLLGKQIELVTADGATTPTTGVGNVRNFILQDNVKAIFGPTSSAVAAAEEHVAAQYQVPIFLIASNDISLTTTHFTKYAFQLLPSSYMEPHAIAAYMAKKGWENYFTIAPDYSFGHNSVKQFLVAMKDYGAKINVVGQQWPKLGATDYTSYITAILSDHPDAVYAELYGGDLLTFTKQAEGFDLFQKVHAYALYTQGVLKALGKKAPAGVITSSRAPFYAIHTADMRRFTAAYHKEYGDWPSAWALIAYTGVQTWAQGVKKAHSFDGEKVSAALSGATVKTIRGPIKLRACDHQAELPEYVGPLSEKINPKYGFRTIHPIYTPEVKKIMMSCSQVRAQQPD